MYLAINATLVDLLLLPLPLLPLPYCLADRNKKDLHKGPP